MSKNITAIVGTYRKGKTIDVAVDELLHTAQQNGCRTEKIYLLDKQIEFCTNCRNCTQQAGTTTGDCVISDDMEQIFSEINSSDSIVLASPVNFSNITALMKKFVERLLPYIHWPWGTHIPRNRIKPVTKKAVIITSSSCPEFLGKLLFRNVFSVLKLAANTMGAKVVTKIYIGCAGVDKEQPLPEKYKKQAIAAGKILSI